MPRLQFVATTELNDPLLHPRCEPESPNTALDMAKNKNKTPNANDKTAIIPQDDAGKKPPKVRAESCANSKSSSGRFGALISAFCYLVLVSGVALASFYLQRLLTEVNQIRLESEESLQKNSELVLKVETALQQVRRVLHSPCITHECHIYPYLSRGY